LLAGDSHLAHGKWEKRKNRGFGQSGESPKRGGEKKDSIAISEQQQRMEEDGRGKVRSGSGGMKRGRFSGGGLPQGTGARGEMAKKSFKKQLEGRQGEGEGGKVWGGLEERMKAEGRGERGSRQVEKCWRKRAKKKKKCSGKRRPKFFGTANEMGGKGLRSATRTNGQKEKGKREQTQTEERGGSS